jgi:hypothetical protein
VKKDRRCGKSENCEGRNGGAWSYDRSPPDWTGQDREGLVDCGATLRHIWRETLQHDAKNHKSRPAPEAIVLLLRL